MHNIDVVKKVTPEKAQAILASNGMSISLAKAALVLDFLYRMALMDVNRFNEGK